MSIRLLAVMILMLAPTLGRACTVPVFRYALERWDLAKYEVTVFYERELPPELDKALKVLEGGAPIANFTVVRVDLQGKVAPEYAKQWAMQSSKKTLPWLAARLPETSAKLPDAWAGPLTQENLRRLLDSPARQQLVKYLSQGTTAVFMLLPGRDEKANAKARELLETELPRLAKIMQLPELKAEDKLRSSIPLKIEFATLLLNRDEPAEQALIETVLNTDADLIQVRGPIILPVIGRGRLLCSMFGDDLNPDDLKKVVAFLCGECSCTLKELNPGVDLLIAADWPELLARPFEAPTPADTPEPIVTAAAKTPVAAPTQVAVSALASSSEGVVVPPSVPVAQSNDAGCCFISTHAWLLFAVAGSGLLVLATGVWVLKGSRKP